MKKNIGIYDRIIRASIGIILLGYAWFAGSWIAFFLALFTFFEAFASWCLLYQLLGKDSCPK